MKVLSYALGGFLAVGALGACSSSHKASSGSGSTTSTTASASPASTGQPETASQFCQQASTLETDTNSAASDATLSSAKTDFAKVLTDAEAMSNPPGAIAGPVKSFTADLKAINNWLDTQATQAELNGNSAPKAVAGPIADLNTQGKSLSSWVSSNCKS